MSPQLSERYCSADFNPAEQGIGRVRTLARERLVSKVAVKAGLMRPFTRDEVMDALRSSWRNVAQQYLRDQIAS
eukprot:gene20291-26421_t